MLPPIRHDYPPKNPSDMANEIIANLSNLAKIPTQYYDYDNGLKLLHSLAKLEYKAVKKNDNQGGYTMELEHYPEGSVEHAQLNALKRHSSFSLDHYSKGVYKLRKFDQSSSLNLDNLSQTSVEKVDFKDLIPQNREELIEPHLTRLINLHSLLSKTVNQQDVQQSEVGVRRFDDILLKSFQDNINTLLRTGNRWLNKELLKKDENFDQYHQLLEKMLELLNTKESIQQIMEGGVEADQDWASFFKAIPIFTKKVLWHMSLVCETITAIGMSRPIFLEIFRKTILNNLENKDFCFYGLELFLNLINKEAFSIVDKFFWPIAEFQSSIASSTEKALEMITTNENPGIQRLSDNKIRDYTIKYLYLLDKRPEMIEKLMLSFAELAPVAQQVILDKFEIFDKARFLEYVSMEVLLKLFRFPKNHEKLLVKFIEKYARDLESLQGIEDLLLPEINKFCLENNHAEKLFDFLPLNSEPEFYKIIPQMVAFGGEGFFIETIPILLTKAPKLAESLFIGIHERDLSNAHNATVVKIEDIFFKTELFFEKPVLLSLLQRIVEMDSLSPLIMRTIHKTFQFFFNRKEEIFEGLEGVVARLIERNMMENERIWTGMKKFFRLDIKRSVNLLLKLPESFKKDFFNKE